jgi:AraC-like DNA-binding protein
LTRSTVADSGYADQAHLIRDFHQFTGASPTAFLAHPQTQTAVPPPA